MKHINNFEAFSLNEHVYKKAMAKDSKNWKKNYEGLLKYLTRQIEDRQLKNFEDDGENITFKIRNRKYKIDRSEKLCIYQDTKEGENEIELELTGSQLKDLISLLKKPIKSERRKSRGEEGLNAGNWEPYIKD